MAGMRPGEEGGLMQNDRGVALLIVLLVTALLIALIFEFAYATRVSLNNAVSFRDSQRAYFLARAGIQAFIKYPLLKDSIAHGEWQPLPPLTEEIAGVMVRWEDERSKININTISDPSPNWLENLFESKQISTDVVESIKELKRGKTFTLVSELHAVMSDEEYNKIVNFVTAHSDSKININTASEDVLNSIFRDKMPNVVTTILNDRKTRQISPGDAGLNTTNMGTDFGKLQQDSSVLKVYAYATVGGYTKQVEAIIQGKTISYWKAL